MKTSACSWTRAIVKMKWHRVSLIGSPLRWSLSHVCRGKETWDCRENEKCVEKYCESDGEAQAKRRKQTKERRRSLLHRRRPKNVQRVSCLFGVLWSYFWDGLVGVLGSCNMAFGLWRMIFGFEIGQMVAAYMSQLSPASDPCQSQMIICNLWLGS